MPRTLAPRRLVVALTMLVLFSAIGVPPSLTKAEERAAPTAVAHDVLVLVDVTGSMATDHGEGSVWSEVSASLTALAGRLAPGTNVALVPFDAGPRLSLAYPPPVNQAVHPVAADVEVTGRLQAHVAALPTTGQGTHIYESVEFALGELARWRAETPDLLRIQTLILYTDGEDNGPHAEEGTAGLAALVRRVQQADRPLTVVYHDVAGVLDEHDQQSLEAAGVQVVAVEPVPLVAVERSSLDLGQIEPGKPVTFELTLTSAFADVFGRSVDASIAGSGALALRQSPATLAPMMSFEVSVADEQAPAGFHDVELLLHPVNGDFLFVPAGRLSIRFEMPTGAPAPVPAGAPGAAQSEGPAVPNAQRSWLVPAFGLGATSLVTLGCLVAVMLLRRRRLGAAGTTFHRLLARHGSEPGSLLDPGTEVIALTSEDLEHRERSVEHTPSPPHPRLGLLRERMDLTLRQGELYVRPLNVPLFVGSETVADEGRTLRTGECLRAGDLHVRYDRCEVRE